MPSPGSFNYSHIVDYVCDFCPLPGPDVGPSALVLSILFSILVCAAECLFCACLASVQVSAGVL